MADVNEHKKRAQHRIAKNIGNMALILWFFLLVLAGRYGYLQLYMGTAMTKHMRDLTVGQWRRQSPRGAILDRNGRELAVTLIKQSLFIDPNNVKDRNDVAKKLAPLIGLTPADILADIDQGGGFVWVKHYLSDEEEKAVRQLCDDEEYNCLGFEAEPKRFYPNDYLAANILGFVGTEDKGLYGIEQALDEQLKGDMSAQSLQTDRSATPILDSLLKERRYNGQKVYLTIDSNIQFITEQVLDEIMAENQPLRTSAVVIDPRNGEVLAMADRPTYNPNKFEEADAERWKNHVVSYMFEPGSTFKSVVAAAALQEGVVEPDTVLHDPGVVKVSDRKIMNWDGEGRGAVTFTDIIKNSLNTGFAMIGLEMGPKRLVDYAKKFGFGKADTGIELAGEEAGLIYDLEQMFDPETATMAIGQSVAVTPLQLARAMGAIANDGKLMKIHLVQKIERADGTVLEETKPEVAGQPITHETAVTLVDLLEQVVATGGGGKAKVDGYRVGGKTGTAQKVLPGGAGYMDGHYIASFCGFGPVEKPRLVVYVMIDDPSGIYYGGQIAAPMAGKIMTQAFRYLRIEPTTDPLDKIHGSSVKYNQ